jgi:hypothetical protein
MPPLVDLLNIPAALSSSTRKITVGFDLQLPAGNLDLLRR